MQRRRDPCVREREEMLWEAGGYAEPAKLQQRVLQVDGHGQCMKDNGLAQRTRLAADDYSVCRRAEEEEASKEMKKFQQKTRLIPSTSCEHELTGAVWVRILSTVPGLRQTRSHASRVSS